MVCVYCRGSASSVVNSRLQKRNNKIWRRRKCQKCDGIFTTHESIDLSSALVLKKSDGLIEPFSTYKLFISIHESCRHRPNSENDAGELTQTIVGKILATADSGLIHRGQLISLAISTLESFDPTASTVYEAYHPPRD